MANIELVIKIPEGLKNDFESEQWTALSCMEMKNALERATSLPKGHGRLIDENDLMAKMVDFCVVYDEIMETPTIVEEDTE